jgi:hypothetical protein
MSAVNCRRWKLEFTERASAWDVFHQQMAFGEQAHQREPDHFCLAPDDRAQSGLQFGKPIQHSGTRANRFAVGHHSL